MTATRVAFVDIYVCRNRDQSFEMLVLHRAPGRTRAGAWETVHGRIEPDETPVAAARRELAEETGIEPAVLYNLSRVESFYLHGTDEIVLIPAFVAIVDPKAAVRLSEEHDEYEWLSDKAAAARFDWPRERRAAGDSSLLFRTGSAGVFEGVLRVDEPQ